MRSSLLSIVTGILLAAVAAALFKPTLPFSQCYDSNTNDDDLCETFIKQQQQQAIFDTNVTFSSKTSYFFNATIQDESIQHGCTAIKIYLILRHGTRNPNEKHIKKYNSLHDLVKKLVNTDVMKKITEWVNPFPISMAGQLSIVGMKEHYCLAKRFQLRFPTLFSKNYSDLTYAFRTSFKARTIQSALSFGQFLFEDAGPLNGFQTLSNFIDEFLATKLVLDIQTKLQQQLNPAHDIWNVSVKDVVTMYELCAIETANFGHSVWCHLFSNLDLQVLEYYEDMKDYWKKGYGNSINWRMACKLVGDMIDTLTANTTRNVVDKDEEHNDKVVLRFAHAETLIPLVCALGLYKDTEPLSPKKYKEHRYFHLSDISPFSGNLGFVLYKCPTNDISSSAQSFFVRVLSNESPVFINHPFCSNDIAKESGGGGDWCPLDKFSEIIQDITNNLIIYPCNFQKVCSNN